MKRTMASLTREALHFATSRGHNMQEIDSWGNDSGEADHIRFVCTRCGCYVDCMTNPPPNGVDIGGDAVAINCGDKRRSAGQS